MVDWFDNGGDVLIKEVDFDCMVCNFVDFVEIV